MAVRNNIKISVIMPAYNASLFIGEAIESVLSQDYNNFELLIGDDCSEDNTKNIIKKFEKYPQVRCRYNKRRLGAGATRNNLIAVAKGPYISVCDADDIMLPGNLKTLSRVLDINPNVGAVYADILTIERNHSKKIIETPDIKEKNYKKGWDILEDFINHPGSMIRKHLILEVGGYTETVYSIEDWDLWLKLAETTKFKYLKGEVYYVYRRHPKSLTKTDKKKEFDRLKIISEAIKRRYNFKFEI